MRNHQNSKMIILSIVSSESWQQRWAMRKPTEGGSSKSTGLFRLYSSNGKEPWHHIANTFLYNSYQFTTGHWSTVNCFWCWWRGVINNIGITSKILTEQRNISTETATISFSVVDYIFTASDLWWLFVLDLMTSGSLERLEQEPWHCKYPNLPPIHLT